MKRSPPLTLVCFAVKQEAKYFRRIAGSQPGVETLLTGIGQRNAERAIRAALAVEDPRLPAAPLPMPSPPAPPPYNWRRESWPGLVLSCGFAGGLRPELATGTVVFATDGES